MTTAGGLGACTPGIGDKCTFSTDCSVQGNLVCDTSQAGGYCTMLGCTANSCANNAACVEFRATLPGCGYDDYRSPSRAGQSMCMKPCGSDSDCRQGDGYGCRDPSHAPWGAVVLDDSPSKVCLFVAVPSDGAAATAAVTSADAQVCSAERPDVPPLDAAFTPTEGGVDGGAALDAGDASSDAAADGGTDAATAADAGRDASGPDATLADAAPEVDAADAVAADAPDGD